VPRPSIVVIARPWAAGTGNWQVADRRAVGDHGASPAIGRARSRISVRRGQAHCAAHKAAADRDPRLSNRVRAAIQGQGVGRHDRLQGPARPAPRNASPPVPQANAWYPPKAQPPRITDQRARARFKRLRESQGNSRLPWPAPWAACSGNLLAERLGDGALRHDADQVSAVVGARMDIGVQPVRRDLEPLERFRI